jgi:2-oxoglutarate ferredoxin oxidoreductase subunit delta
MKSPQSTQTVETRGTVTIDIDRCKGCELCIPACKPGVLEMSTQRNELGVPYPELSAGCTGCSACLLVCPDFCFEVYQFETPLQIEARKPETEEVTR